MYRVVIIIQHIVYNFKITIDYFPFIYIVPGRKIAEYLFNIFCFSYFLRLASDLLKH